MTDPDFPNNERSYIGNVEYVQAKGATLEEMRLNARNSSMCKRGDMRLVWVNEGDLLMSEISAEKHDE